MGVNQQQCEASQHCSLIAQVTPFSSDHHLNDMRNQILQGIVGSEMSQNESSPNFSIFRPEFCPEFCSEFPPNFRGVFVLRFVGNGGQKKITKK